jgi:aryl-alcohol dehydrogenase-like predicted oxidoreductase
MDSTEALSRCGLGCVNLGSGGRRDIRLVRQAMDLGVRIFDTADAYGGGSSERVLGQALRHRRDGVFVATKGGYVFRERTGLERTARRGARPLVQRAGRIAGGSTGSTPLARRRAYARQDFSPVYLRIALEASLRRLDTDYIDLYQLHGPRGVADDDVLELMLDLRSEGKIGGFGVGLESLDHAADWLSTSALSSIQIPFGVLDPEAGDDVIPRARAQGVRVVVRGVFAGGLLADRSHGDKALSRPGQTEVRTAVGALASATGVDALQIGAWFVTANPSVTTVLVGTSSVRHLEQSLRYFETPPPAAIRPLLGALVGRDDRAHAADPAVPE